MRKEREIWQEKSSQSKFQNVLFGYGLWLLLIVITDFRIQLKIMVWAVEISSNILLLYPPKIYSTLRNGVHL
jgi:hypothetical protein